MLLVMIIDKRLKKSIYSFNKSLLKNYSKTYRLPFLFMDKKLRVNITHLYGFLRVVDEIIDTPCVENKKQIISSLKYEIENIDKQKSFITPNLLILKDIMEEFKIDKRYILGFLEGMEMDINTEEMSMSNLKKYTELTGGNIGVIGLKIASELDNEIFVEGKGLIFDIASKFQLLNLIRDYDYDSKYLGRFYLSHLRSYDPMFQDTLNNIHVNLKLALKKIKKLPRNCRLAIRLSIYGNILILKKMRRKVKSYEFKESYT